MLLPIALNLQDVPCLVVGGGEIGARKVRSLLECGARVKVVSLQLCDALEAIRANNEYSNEHSMLQVFERPFERDDCDDMKLVFACTDSRDVNLDVANCARKTGALCNVSDDGQSGDFGSMAVVRRGEITIAISTNGGSPALSKHLKREIESCIGDEYAQLLQLMSDARAMQNRQASVQSERAAMWHRVLASDVLELLRRGETQSAQNLVREIMKSNEPEA